MEGKQEYVKFYDIRDGETYWIPVTAEQVDHLRDIPYWEITTTPDPKYPIKDIYSVN